MSVPEGQLTVVELQEDQVSEVNEVQALRASDEEIGTIARIEQMSNIKVCSNHCSLFVASKTEIKRVLKEIMSVFPSVSEIETIKKKDPDLGEALVVCGKSLVTAGNNLTTIAMQQQQLAAALRATLVPLENLAQQVLIALEKKQALSSLQCITEELQLKYTSALKFLTEVREKFLLRDLDIILEPFANVLNQLPCSPGMKEAEEKYKAELEKRLKEFLNKVDEYNAVKSEEMSAESNVSKWRSELSLIEDRTADLEQIKKDILKQKKKIVEAIESGQDDFNSNIKSIQKSVHKQVQEMEERTMQRMKKEQETKSKLEEDAAKFRATLLEQSNASLQKCSFENHVAFTIDVSGSMSGTRIKEARCALESFVSVLNDSPSNNLLTLITFNTEAKSVFQQRSARDVKSKDLKDHTSFWNNFGICSGGTNYYCAFHEAREQLKLTPKNMRPVLVFMTDGLTDARDMDLSKAKINSIASENKDLILFVVGFHCDNIEFLRPLVLAGNGGKDVLEFSDGSKISLLMSATDATTLTCNFNKIATILTQETGAHKLKLICLNDTMMSITKSYDNLRYQQHEEDGKYRELLLNQAKDTEQLMNAGYERARGILQSKLDSLQEEVNVINTKMKEVTGEKSVIEGHLKQAENDLKSKQLKAKEALKVYSLNKTRHDEEIAKLTSEYKEKEKDDAQLKTKFGFSIAQRLVLIRTLINEFIDAERSQLLSDNQLIISSSYTLDYISGTLMPKLEGCEWASMEQVRCWEIVENYYHVKGLPQLLKVLFPMESENDGKKALLLGYIEEIFRGTDLVIPKGKKFKKKEDEVLELLRNKIESGFTWFDQEGNTYYTISDLKALAEESDEEETSDSDSDSSSDDDDDDDDDDKKKRKKKGKDSKSSPKDKKNSRRRSVKGSEESVKEKMRKKFQKKLAKAEEMLEKLQESGERMLNKLIGYIRDVLDRHSFGDLQTMRILMRNAVNHLVAPVKLIGEGIDRSIAAIQIQNKQGQSSTNNCLLLN